MSLVGNLLRLSCGIVGGLLCGHHVARCASSFWTADSQPDVVQRDDLAVELNGSSRPTIAQHVEPIPTFAPDTDAGTLATYDSVPTGDTSSHDTTTALENEIEQASIEMRQLDRLELPERGEVARRLHTRLCSIGDQLIEDERNPNAIPTIGQTTWNSRRREVTDNRDLIRSLLAAIAVAPEKSAFMSNASRQLMEERGTFQPSQLVFVGNLKRIKENDRAWFFLLDDPFHESQTHMVRVDRSQLTQRVPLGSRVVALGRTVPHDGMDNNTPIVATEIYAVRQSAR